MPIDKCANELIAERALLEYATIWQRQRGGARQRMANAFGAELRRHLCR